MRILFISDNFPPETNAPASRTYEHAKRWVESGVDVTVLTCAPNFPEGQVHAGYRNVWRSVESVDGIRVVRVKSYITRNEGFVRRTLDYISFMFSAVFFGTFERRPDVIVGTSPQFFAAVAAWLLSIAKWRPFVFELRDLWPASIVTVGAMRAGFVTRVLEWMELFLYRRAEAIVSVTESFKSDLVERGIRKEKIHVVRNGVDLSFFGPREKAKDLAIELGVDGKFVVAYLGTHGMAHALENVLDAAELLANRPEIAFLFVGHGARKDELVASASRRGLRNTVFHDPVPKGRMPELWSVCDVALVHLKDDPVFATVIPSKIFEAFGMGVAVMVVQPAGEASDIVSSAGAGEWVAPENPAVLAEAITRWEQNRAMVAAFGERALLAAQNYSRDRQASAMCDILKAVAMQRSPQSVSASRK